MAIPFQPSGASGPMGDLLGSLMGPSAPTFESPAAADPALGAPPTQTAKGGPDWTAILKAVMPFVMAGIAGRQGGRVAAGEALMGYSVSAARKRQEDQARFDAEAAQAAHSEEKLWSRNREVAKYAQEQARQAATFLQTTIQNINEMTDPALQAETLAQAKRIGAELWQLPETAWTVPVRPNQAKLQAQAQALLDKLQTEHGDDFDRLVDQGSTVTFNGQPKTLKALQALANVAVTDPSGAVVPPRARVRPVTEGTELAEALEAKATELGVPVAQLPRDVRAAVIRDTGALFESQKDDTENEATFIANALKVKAEELGVPVANLPKAVAQQTRLAARKQWAAQDDRPLASQAPTASGLSPRIENQVNSIARAFGVEPVVKKVQTMAEAVNFMQSLDPNSLNPADDQAVIYAFAKAMNPDSVLRESEYETVKRYAQTLAQTYGLELKRLGSNTPFLTKEARANMTKTVTARYAAGRKQYDNLAAEYARRINKVTGRADGVDYLTDYAGAFPDVGGAAPSNLIQTAPPDQSGNWKWNGTAWVKK